MTDLPLTPDDVEEIVAILDGSPYAALDLKTARFRLRVARAEVGEGWTQEWHWDDTDAVAVVAVEAVVADEGGPAIRAPLPGTFYRAPQPGAPPFVDVGSRVEPDTVVAIIETMKLMNPVHAGLSGVIEEILVENSAMVAKGAALIRIAVDA